MISVPYTEYLKFRKNWILYTRILTKKYHIPELKWPGIPYTQNPWPGLSSGVCRFTLKTEIKFNMPNIIIKDQELKKCLLIDMAVSTEQISCQNSWKAIKSHYLRKSKIARHSSKIRIFFYFAKTSLLVT